MLSEVKYVVYANKGPHEDPSYASKYDSGMDVRAWIDNDEKKIILQPLERELVHTGIYVELPHGTEIQVRPKSGRAMKEGLFIANSPGTVDNLYRGEICVICVNLSNKPIIINDGEKIAQLVLCPVCHEGLVELVKVDNVSTDTERGEGGFGHNGIN